MVEENASATIEPNFYSKTLGMLIFLSAQPRVGPLGKITPSGFDYHDY